MMRDNNEDYTKIELIIDKLNSVHSITSLVQALTWTYPDLTLQPSFRMYSNGDVFLIINVEVSEDELEILQRIKASERCVFSIVILKD